MQEFWFYVQIGFQHVMDWNAYDHMLFLGALALPFKFNQWKHVVILATLFTIAHCVSLVVSALNLVQVPVEIIEFLIPGTIFLTAAYNVWNRKLKITSLSLWVHYLATGFFGLIHGFGFSNYFKMLLAGEDEIGIQLFGFATGIEFSQVAIILLILAIGYLTTSIFKVKRDGYILIVSIIIVFITIPLMIKTFPW
jgi:hypothetical protein